MLIWRFALSLCCALWACDRADSPTQAPTSAPIPDQDEIADERLADAVSEEQERSGDEPLTSLAAVNRGIESLEGIGALWQLRSLDLSRNRIVDITPLSALRSLRFLDLSFNNISDITHLRGLDSLAVLSLAGNQVGDISVLAGLAALSAVDLTGNPLASHVTSTVEQLRAVGVEVTVDAEREPVFGGSILYTSDASGDFEIYAIDLDGLAPARLTTSDGDDLAPAWSPGFDRIAFSSNRDGVFGIYTMAADGSDVRPVYVSTANASEPSWSPDGARIVFVESSDGSSWLRWVDVASGESGQLTHGPSHTQPDWGGGETIVFSDGSGIYDVDLSGNLRPIALDDSTKKLLPSRSPDGLRVAFIEEQGATSRIVVVDSAGARTVVTEALSPDEYFEGLDWSPGNGHVVYVLRSRLGFSSIQWSFAEPDEVGEEIVAGTPLHWSPRWSPFASSDYIGDAEHSSTAVYDVGGLDPDAVVDVPDPALLRGIRSALEEDPGETVTAGEVAEIGYLAVDSAEIRSLEGLEALQNLEFLFVSGNDIEDLSPVSGLRQLSVIWASENRIRRVPDLSNTRVFRLVLNFNPLADLSALIVSRVSELQVTGCGLTDLAIIGQMQNLRELTASRNSVADLSPLLNLLEVEPRRLEKVTVRRNPLSEHSIDEVIPRLVEGGVEVVY